MQVNKHAAITLSMWLSAKIMEIIILFKLSDRVNMFDNSSQVAAIALGPYTMHPEQWAETLTK